MTVGRRTRALPAFGRTIACFLSTALCWGGGFPLDTAPGAADPSGTSERRPEDRPGVRAWLAGDGERALQELEAAASRGRDRLLELNRAVALLYLGRGGEAETLLVALHARERRWAPALRWLARAQKEPGRAEVVETAAALVALSGAEARDHYWAARLFAERKDLARARDGFARAVREEPDHYLAWLALGDAEAALGRREGARRAWSVARELYGGGDELFRLGRLLWEDGRRSEARSLFREALETREATLYEESVRALDPGIDAVAPPPLPSPCSILGPGEVLRYRAKFLFFHLANLTLEDRGPAVVEGQPACRLAFAVKSKPGVPFLRIDSRFESTIAREGPVLRHRNFTDEGAASRRATSYEMDPDRRACTVRQVTDGVFGFERLAMPPGAQDGISVIQLARAAARTGRAVSVLTAVDGTWKGTQIRPGKTEKVRWRGRELPAVRIEMVGHYRGPAGLSGAITLWISADERAVPYRARFKIGIGSVTLELEPGREPPVAPGGVLKPEVQREAEQSANAEPVLCLQGVHFELLAQHPDAPTPPHGSCSCRRRAAEGGRRSAAPLPRCPPRGPTSRRSGLSNRGGPTAPLLGGGRFI